jgi:hypothetical protein
MTIEDFTEAEQAEKARIAAEPFAELALATIAIARALRPANRVERSRFDNKIRRALTRTQGNRDLQRMILKSVLR